MPFPSDFIWGAATAAYQIEGAVAIDGRSPSIWDVFANTPGTIFNGDTGAIACDHYHRYKEDVAIMKEIGLQAYRFSIAWSRIIPSGRGPINAKGLDFYERLVDTLLAHNIQPWATLFHWDMPQCLQLQGGWMNPNIVDDFANYTQAVVDRLGDRVKNWMTFNEPQCSIALGLEVAAHAPGLKHSLADTIPALHHHLKAHGRAVEILRAGSGKDSRIGYVSTCSPQIPHSNNQGDIDAARQGLFAYKQYGPQLWTLSAYTDPVYLGKYPADMLLEAEQYLPLNWQNDMSSIAQPLDFFAINLYSGIPVKADANGSSPATLDAGHSLTANKWKVLPEVLYWTPRFAHERYKLPVIITENGISNPDWVHLDGQVHDPARIDFTTRYLQSLERCHNDGFPVAGYFHWSFMDNFEWAEGYKERFGLVHVDYQSQKRTIKDSGYWYRRVIESNGAIIH